MDWENERYVRLYTRDTVTWKTLPWQAKVIMPLIFRKATRSGLIELGGEGIEGLAALIEVPFEVVQPGVERLAAKGIIQLVNDDTIVIPNFVPAQEARSSAAQRKRDERERKNSMKQYEVLVGQTVTNCDVESRDVTECHTESPGVTFGHSVPSLAVPKELSPPQARTRDMGDPAEPATAPASPGPAPSEPLAQTKSLTKAELYRLWLAVVQKTPSGNWVLLEQLAERCTTSAAARGAQPLEHAQRLLAAFLRIVDAWARQGRPVPQRSCEGFDRNFTACEEVLDGERDPDAVQPERRSTGRPWSERDEPSRPQPQLIDDEYVRARQFDDGVPPPPEWAEMKKRLGAA